MVEKQQQPKRKNSTVKCIDCGAEFLKRGTFHKRCEPCAAVREVQRHREGYERRRAGLSTPSPHLRKNHDFEWKPSAGELGEQAALRAELGIGERRPLTIREAATLAEAERMERDTV